MHCVVLTTTEPNASVTVPGEGDGLSDGIKEFYDLDHEEESDDEDNDEHFPVKGFFIDDDAILGKWVDISIGLTLLSSIYCNKLYVGFYNTSLLFQAE